MDKVYVSGDIFVYWKEGDNSLMVSPDVFVVRGAERRMRTVYRSWEDGGRLPEFVIEILSGNIGDKDLDDKLKRYRDDLRVKEYFIFDPGIGRLDPPLQGYRLRGKKYVPIKAIDGRLPSVVTGLHLEADGDELRLWDPSTGVRVPTEAERREQEEAARPAEATARRAAERRVRELEAELRRRDAAT